MINILFAEDEARIRRIIIDFCRKDGYNFLEAEDGQEAIDIYDEQHEIISLVILDVMMPMLDGWSVLRHIRKRSQTVPIMMMTARGDDDDQVYGLESGADDYVAKPISPVLLVARIKALLRRAYDNDFSTIALASGIRIDELGRTIYVDEQLVDLSPKEYELLVYMASNSGIALSREQFFNVVWGYDYMGDLRALDTHIKNLRAKLGDKGKCIKTIRGYGYKFLVEE